jgi:hypothetical protein
MSYTLPPQVLRSGIPGATDDSSKGFVVGSAWINTSVTPRTLYICTNASVGAATWASGIGVTQHNALTGLGWSASGHTGVANAVAAFDGSGNPATVQATEDGTVLTFTGGVLTFAAALITVGLASPRTIEREYLPAAPLTIESASVDAGVIA